MSIVVKRYSPDVLVQFGIVRYVVAVAPVVQQLIQDLIGMLSGHPACTHGEAELDVHQ